MTGCQRPLVKSVGIDVAPRRRSIDFGVKTTNGFCRPDSVWRRSRWK